MFVFQAFGKLAFGKLTFRIFPRKEDSSLELTSQGLTEHRDLPVDQRNKRLTAGLERQCDCQKRNGQAFMSQSKTGRQLHDELGVDIDDIKSSAISDDCKGLTMRNPSAGAVHQLALFNYCFVTAENEGW